MPFERLRHATRRRVDALQRSSNQLGLSVLHRTLAAYQQRKAPALALSDYRNFLLLPYHRALGSAVVGTAVVGALQAALPGARVCAAAGGPGLAALRHHPGLSRLVGAPDPRDDLRGCARAIREADLFNGEPFVVLHTVGIDKPAFVCAGILAGASASFGFGCGDLVVDPGRSRIANDLRILKRLGHGAALDAALAAEPELYEPKVYFDDADRRAVGEMIDVRRPFALMITQVRPFPRRRWPAANFLAVSQALHHEQGLELVFDGVRGEEAAVETLRSALPFATASTVGRTTIPQLAALADLARVVVGFDTGSMHVARAAGARMVILAGVEYPTVDFSPLGNPRARILYTVPEDVDTGMSVPGEVSAAQVMREVEGLLAERTDERGDSKAEMLAAPE